MSKLTKALTAAAGNAGGDNLYVEDVFSTYLYDGTGAAQDIVNGIDLAGEGGLVWIKDRVTSGRSHFLFDSDHLAAPYYNQYLSSNNTDAIYSATGTGNGLGGLFNSDGFPVQGNHSTSGKDYASWTFRKAEKFFDVVTYTGDGVAGRTVAHNLGSVPAVMIVKELGNTNWWPVYHISVGATKSLYLSLNQGENTWDGNWNNTAPTSAVFTLGYGTETNRNGGTYVAYLFASDAGGFGDDGSESIIKCGSYTGNNSSAGPTIDLGFEPQWVLIKQSSAAGENWVVADNMRGVATGGNDAYLFPNTSNSESSTGARDFIEFNATGFTLKNNYGFTNASATYIYIAIRRPMKTPESGTEVFAIGQGDGDSDIPDFISNFPVDAAITKRTSAGNNGRMSSRLTGANYLSPNLTQAESADGAATFDFMNGWGSDGTNRNTNEYAWMFKRATGFFDVVAYTGTGSAHNEEHNLGVVPELLIFKTRSASVGWAVSCGEAGYTNGGRLELSNQFYSEPNRVTGTPTSTTVPIGTDAYVNVNGRTYIAYLFATLAGVSKVGSYTGTGSNVDVDCGFSAGARFILIKRTDSTGDWYVWDSERGIVAGNDPYLLLNSTAAEVTSTDYIDPLSSGFTVTSSAPAALNASGGEYIFLAIA